MPTYHISLQYVHQYSHVYNTNKIWHNTYLYGNPDKIIEFKRGLYQQVDYQYPGILYATFDKIHKLVIRIDNHLPSEEHLSTINTDNGSIKTYKFIHIPSAIVY